MSITTRFTNFSQYYNFSYTRRNYCSFIINIIKNFIEKFINFPNDLKIQKNLVKIVNLNSIVTAAIMVTKMVCQ